jgi:hypothetical protein
MSDNDEEPVTPVRGVSKDRLRDLETENKALKKENDFLKKLRAFQEQQMLENNE